MTPTIWRAAMNSLSNITDLIRRAKSALLIAHVSPDGDTLGSALGLAFALRQAGLRVRVACADPVPHELRFLPGSDEITAQPWVDEEIILIIDASDLERIGSLYQGDVFARIPVGNVDHHVTNQLFGQVNYVEPRASTAELALDLVTQLGVTLDATIASCLLTGVMSDTLGFRTSNASAETLRAAAQLVDAGASLKAVADAVFNHRSMAMLRVWGPALANAQFSDGILWVEISQNLLRAAHADESASRGLANFVSTFDGAKVSAVFRELRDHQTEISLRSTPDVDVSRVALSFGGGGHPQAAGCTVAGDLAQVRDDVLRALRREIAATERELGK